MGKAVELVVVSAEDLAKEVVALLVEVLVKMAEWGIGEVVGEGIGKGGGIGKSGGIGYGGVRGGIRKGGGIGGGIGKGGGVDGGGSVGDDAVSGVDGGFRRVVESKLKVERG